MQKGVAVEVHELRKEFRRKDSRKRGEKRGEKRSRVALDGVSFTMEKGETVAILGQNGSGKSTLVRLLSTLLLPDGGWARIFGHDVVSDERAVRRLVNRVSVEASFFKKMSSAENLSYASRLLRHDARRDTRDRIPEILERVGFPRGPPRRSRWRPVARDAAEGRARSRAAHLAGSPPPRRADDGPRPALEARGAGVHPRDPRDPRLDDPALHARPRRGRDARGARSASSTAGSCSRSSRPTISSAGTAPTRSRRRSSPRPGVSSRQKATTTTTGRCSHESAVGRRCERSSSEPAASSSGTPTSRSATSGGTSRGSSGPSRTRSRSSSSRKGVEVERRSSSTSTST